MGLLDFLLGGDGDMGKWRATITLSDSTVETHDSVGQRLDMEVSDNGDLSIYRTHPDMYSAPVIVSFAAGYWHMCSVDKVED